MQDPKDLQLEPDVSKLKSMKRSVLGRRVVNKIKRPEKTVPTIGGYFCFTIVFSYPLLIAFVNSLDPDQARQNVGPDLGANCLTLMVSLKVYFEKVNFEQNQQITKKSCKITQLSNSSSYKYHYHI